MLFRSWERNIIANSIEEILQMQIEQIKKGEPKDFFEFVLKNSIYVDKKKTLDGLHPNEDGYEIMKKILFKGIGDYNEN